MEPKQTKRKRFNFAETKAMATSPDRAVRKQVFMDYFADFSEFPTYFFDNEHGIDAKLAETVQDLARDPELSKEMRKGLDQLLMRLPAVE